jgi:hypothetical protein
VGTARVLGLVAVGLAVAAGCARGGDTNDLGSNDGGADVLVQAEAATDANESPDATDGGGGGGDDAKAEASTAFDAPIAFSEAAAGDGPAGQDGATSDGGIDTGPTVPAQLGAWGFDEGSGTTTVDLSGHGHPATLVGGATFTAAGKQGGGLALDGTSGYADIAIPLIDTSSSFSVLAWVNLTAISAWEVVVSEDDTTGSLFGLKLRGDGSNQFDFDAERTDVTSPAFVVAQSTAVAQAGTWVHLAGVYDATGNGALRLYLNGAIQANAAVGQPLLSAKGHLLVGRGLYNGAQGSYVHGTIDEVAVYGTALTDAQVAAVYASQK